ncbi:MAG: FkbM family methyltransferase [Hyphomicrobium sp.]|nr:FkbM family methyltransferase [Hyphomicrobium sp.]
MIDLKNSAEVGSHPLLSAALFALQAERAQIDLVYHSGLFLYVYKDDWFYAKRVKDDDRNINQGGYKKRLESVSNLPDAGLGEPSIPEKVLLDVARHSPRGLYLDIGTNYGQWVIRAGKHLERAGLKIRTLAFEPGLAARLALVNIALNKLGWVEFHPAAISNITSLVPMFAMPGHTEDNKLINKPAEAIVFPTRASRLDDLLDGLKPAGEIFMKIDTQGNEPEVLDGLRKYRGAPIACLMEFSPLAVSSRLKPVVYVEQLLKDFHVIEMDRWSKPVAVVEPDSISPMIERLKGTQFPFCDFICIARPHPRAAQLLDLVLKGGTEPIASSAKPSGGMLGGIFGKS